MANDQAPRAAAKSGASFLLMVVAILAIAGLMGWLAMQQRERGATAVAEGAGTDSAAVGTLTAEVVSDTAFEQNMRTYRGREIQLPAARFSAGLSPQTFWIELPTGQPFLVKLDSAMIAAGTTPPTGGTLHIVGTVQSKDPALVSQWMQSGVLQTDDQKLQAEFGTTYMEARQIRPAGQ